MYVYKTYVTASQIGPNHLQTVVSVINMMQDCSHFWLDSEPGLKAYLKENNLSILVASRQADIYRLAKCGEYVDVMTSVYYFKGCFGYRNTVISRGGIPYVKSWSLGVFVSAETGKLIRIPGSVASSVVFDPKTDMEYLGKKIVLPDETPEAHPTITARSSDIDFNSHVNNAQYIRMALDLFPDLPLYHRIRVEYKRPARLHDRLLPLVYKSKPGHIFAELRGESGPPFAIVEFSKLGLAEQRSFSEG